MHFRWNIIFTILSKGEEEKKHLTLILIKLKCEKKRKNDSEGGLGTTIPISKHNWTKELRL